MHDLHKTREELISEIDVLRARGARLEEDRASTEHALRSSSERFRRLVESVRIIPWEIDLSGWQFTYVGPQGVSILGYSLEDWYTPGFWLEHTYEDDREIVREGCGQCFFTGREAEFVVRMQTRGRHTVWMHTLASVIPIGVPQFLQGFMIDITERMEAEQKLRQAEEALQQAQKLESLGILAGGVAHDFNNVLVAILGNAGLALMGLPEGAAARETVVEIEKAAVRASELTNQMLAYAGKSQVDVRPLDLSTLVEEMKELLQTLVAKKAVLRFELDDDLPPIEADAVQIRQVVMNLVTNASEALGERRGLVKICTGVREIGETLPSAAFAAEGFASGRHVFVEVTDAGCGMDEDTRQRIFDPFFTTKISGRGLGLAAVLGIVRSHCGAVHVETEVDQGTTFTVVLPASTTAQVHRPDGAADLRDWEGSGTILVIDDEEIVRTVVKAALEKWGFSVLAAADGLEGVETFAAHASEIRAVLLDMTMPNLGGAEALRRMRELRRDTPVVLLSGYAEEDAAAQFRGLGLSGFLHKPFRPPELLAKLRDILTS